MTARSHDGVRGHVEADVALEGGLGRGWWGGGRLCRRFGRSGGGGFREVRLGGSECSAESAPAAKLATLGGRRHRGAEDGVGVLPTFLMVWDDEGDRHWSLAS